MFLAFHFPPATHCPLIENQCHVNNSWKMYQLPLLKYIRDMDASGCIYWLITPTRGGYIAESGCLDFCKINESKSMTNKIHIHNCLGTNYRVWHCTTRRIFDFFARHRLHISNWGLAVSGSRYQGRGQVITPYSIYSDTQGHNWYSVKKKKKIKYVNLVRSRCASIGVVIVYILCTQMSPLELFLLQMPCICKRGDIVYNNQIV